MASLEVAIWYLLGSLLCGEMARWGAQSKGGSLGLGPLIFIYTLWPLALGVAILIIIVRGARP